MASSTAAWINDDVTTSQTRNLDPVRATWIGMTSLLIFTIGMLGNVTTIYIYTRSKKLRRNKVFELILATIDLYALLVLLPIFSIDVYYGEYVSKQFNVAIATCAHNYYITILCSTICRYVAVYHPFKFNLFFDKWRPRFMGIIAVATVAFSTRTLVVSAIFKVKESVIYFLDIMLTTTISFVSIAVLFILIIVKLKKQNKVGVTPQSLEMGAQREEGLARQTATRKKHIVAVKTFIAVSLCYIISYVTAFTVGNKVVPIEVDYLYFLNHISNPVIYLAFNKEFRQEFRKIIRI